MCPRRCPVPTISRLVGGVVSGAPVRSTGSHTTPQPIRPGSRPQWAPHRAQKGPRTGDRANGGVPTPSLALSRQIGLIRSIRPELCVRRLTFVKRGVRLSSGAQRWGRRRTASVRVTHQPLSCYLD
jgi:hypothetical protein